MALNLQDFYQFFKMLPLGDQQVQFRFDNQIEVFGDSYRRIVYNADVEDDPDEFIEIVKEEFAGTEIRWKVGTTDRPQIDWAEKLQNHGFKPNGIELAMILDLEKDDLSRLGEQLADDIEIVEIKATDLFDDQNYALIKRENPERSDEMIKMGIENFISLESKGLNYLHLVAKHGDQWVGHAVLSYIDDSEVAFLVGAMTDEKFRRRGIYSATLAKRAAHAIKKGKRYLVINARAHSSGPILKKVGFQTIGEQVIFSWKEEND